MSIFTCIIYGIIVSLMKKPTTPIVSGVYAIHNKLNNKWYIGSSNDIGRRIKTHKRELINGSHNNLLLQHEFSKFGVESFEFIILIKDVPEDMLLAYEKVMMYKYDSVVMYKGYNQMFSTVNHNLFKIAYGELKEKGLI